MATTDAIKERFERYLGLRAGGVNLRQALCSVPKGQLEAFCRTVAQLSPAFAPRSARGRLFFCGNGGSYDNARLLAQAFRSAGLRSLVPGGAEDYMAIGAGLGYSKIFSESLKREHLRGDDAVIGISGSGNSPNIIEALEYAQLCGARTMCLGGRNGGKMRLVCGDKATLLAPSDCMEAIEDVHAAAGLIAAESIKTGKAFSDVQESFISAFDLFAAEDAVEQLTVLAKQLLRTIEQNSRVFVLGTGIGANHLRADFGRGATNGIPVRGICAPELYSTNSIQATANDDGWEFIFADGLIKLDPGRNDLAILISTPEDADAIDVARDLLVRRGTSIFEIGPGGLEIEPFMRFDHNFAVSLIGHACGEVLREVLHEEWRVRELKIDLSLPAGQRKLRIAETLTLEEKLRKEGTIAEEEVVTFCYGKPYAALAPALVGKDRCFY